MVIRLWHMIKLIRKREFQCESAVELAMLTHFKWNGMGKFVLKEYFASASKTRGIFIDLGVIQFTSVLINWSFYTQCTQFEARRLTTHNQRRLLKQICRKVNSNDLSFYCSRLPHWRLYIVFKNTKSDHRTTQYN